MTDEQAVSPKVVNDHIRNAVEELLRANDVYHRDSYGWLNAEDCDPDSIGHAMWQTDSLSFRALEARVAAMQSQGAAVPQFKPWQQFLITKGGDFEGLMDAARLSIGLALFQRDIGIPQGEVGGFFELHLIAATVTLGAASDRLRDLFIAALFHQDTKKYEKTDWEEKKDRRKYETPFNEAAEQLKFDLRITEALGTLTALATTIKKRRRERNKVVHDLVRPTTSRSCP